MSTEMHTRWCRCLLISLLAVICIGLTACQDHPTLRGWVERKNFWYDADLGRASTLGERLNRSESTDSKGNVSVEYTRTKLPLLEPQVVSETAVEDYSAWVDDRSSVEGLVKTMGVPIANSVFEKANTFMLHIKHARIRSTAIMLPAFPPRSDEPSQRVHVIDRELVIGDLQIEQFDSSGARLDVGLSGTYADGFASATKVYGSLSTIKGIDLVVGFDPRTLDYMTSQEPSQRVLKRGVISQYGELSLRLLATRPAATGETIAVLAMNFVSSESPKHDKGGNIPSFLENPASPEATDQSPPLTKEQIEEYFREAKPIEKTAIVAHTREPESRIIKSGSTSWICHPNSNIAFHIEVQYLNADEAQVKLTRLAWK